MSDVTFSVPTMAELAAKGESPEVLFWVGCAGSFDDRYKRVTKSFVKILHAVDIKFAVLGTEETCTGDPARRAGNEFLFQMQAMNNIQVLNGYGIKKVVTACPHCFNTIKNEYPELGGTYEVVHHSTFLQNLISEGKIKLKEGGSFKGRKITYHDSCYLGRANNVYEAPRAVLEALDADLVEMKRCRTTGLCCGAGGGQMFKEPEKGNQDINVARTEEALSTGAATIAVACPFCMTMMSDGVKNKEREADVQVKDLAELIVPRLKVYPENEIAMFVPFESLADHSRLWIYQSNKTLSAGEIDILSDALRAFTEQWTVHGQPMKTSFHIAHNRFVMLAADEGYNAASGCSIDGSVRTLKALGEELNTDFFDRTQVAFQLNGEVVALPLAELKRQYEAGLWTAETPVFNTLVDTKGNLAAQWLTPAGATWLKRYLPKETISG